MPKKGAAATRFKGQQGSAERPHQRWEIRHDRSTLELEFKDPGLEINQKLVLTQWLAVGLIGVELAKAFADCSCSQKRTTRKGKAGQFKDGFLAFLLSTSKKIDHVSQLPPRILQDFLTWLKDPTLAQRRPYTQLGYWCAAKSIFVALNERTDANEPKIDIPNKPFAGVKVQPAPQQDIDLEGYIAVMEHAANDVRRTMECLWPKLLKLHQMIQNNLSDKSENQSDEVALIARAVAQYGNGQLLPARMELQQHDPQLFRLIEEIGYTDAAKIVHPQMNDWPPFLYLMAAHTGFNQQPLSWLDITRIEECSRMGTAMIYLSAEKFRANSIVRRSFPVSDELLAVSTMIRFVKDWTRLIRAGAPEKAKNDLWLFANKWRNKEHQRCPIGSLALRMKGNYNELQAALRAYCIRRDLRPIGLSEMRLTFSEIFQRARPGDLMGLKILLGHKNVVTTLDNYRTQASIGRGQERLVGAQVGHQRWVTSGGRVDSRIGRKQSERSAATPGFRCSDPFGSPLPGQIEGRACDAYGQCPSCPLATCDTDKAYALARFHQLHQRYEEAKQKLGSAIWEAKFLKPYERLVGAWIPRTSSQKNVVTARSLQLSSLPCLE